MLSRGSFLYCLIWGFSWIWCATTTDVFFGQADLATTLYVLERLEAEYKSKALRVKTAIK